MADDFNDNPGPGAYCIEYKLKYDQTPVCTIASRLRDCGDDAAAGQPGPGTYSPKLIGNAPCYSLPARLQSLHSKNKNPGPGAYSTQTRFRTQSRLPSYTIAAPLAGSTAGKNPGPGAYDPKLRPGWLSYSLRTKTAESARNKNPGPGAYDPLMHNCIPAYSLEKPLEGQGSENLPAPARTTPPGSAAAQRSPCEAGSTATGRRYATGSSVRSKYRGRRKYGLTRSSSADRVSFESRRLPR